MTEFVIKYLFPGILLLILALVAGAQESFVFGFLGFMSFFVAAVVLIAEGWKRRKQ